MYSHPHHSAQHAHRLAACSLRVRAGQPLIRLFPAGEFNAPRGALSGQGPWQMSVDIAARVIALAAARSTDIPIDYEHQILLAEQNGQPAPAAGWIDRASLKWVGDGDEPGLYGAVTWTDTAAAMIGRDEYRYLSPVFPYDRNSGAVLELLHLALTNTPAIDSTVLAAASIRYPQQPLEEETDTMKLADLLARLGLPDTTTETDALAAVAALKAKADDADTQIAALKSANANQAPDPAKFVPVTALEEVKTQLAALKTSQNTTEVDALIKTGIEGGKLLPAQEEWARELGTKDVAALRSYMDKTPAIAALKRTQTDGKEPGDDGEGAELTSEQLAVCKAMGHKPEDYRKQLAQA